MRSTVVVALFLSVSCGGVSEDRGTGAFTGVDGGGVRGDPASGGEAGSGTGGTSVLGGPGGAGATGSGGDAGATGSGGAGVAGSGGSAGATGSGGDAGATGSDGGAGVTGSGGDAGATGSGGDVGASGGGNSGITDAGADSTPSGDADGGAPSPDVSPPSSPVLDAAQPKSATELSLDWTAATDDRTGAGQLRYQVFLATSQGSEDLGGPPAVTVTGVTSAVVGGLALDGTYWLVVRAVDAAGNASGSSNEVQGTTHASFARDVQPIFTAKCALSGCHTAGGSLPPPQGLNLDVGASYVNLVNVVAREGASIGEPNLVRVATSTDLSLSYLWRKVSGIGTILNGLEPRGGPPITDYEKSVLADWLGQGAKDD